jgi:hypothetical protein
VAQKKRKTTGKSRTPKTSVFYVLPRSERHRRVVEVTLEDDARLKLDRLKVAWGLNRSRMVEKLIMDATVPPKFSSNV